MSAQAVGTNITGLNEALRLSEEYICSKLGLECSQAESCKPPAKGLKTLDDFLSDKSYLSGFIPSQADSLMMNSLGSGLSLPANVQRWYNHIKSFSSEEKKQFVSYKYKTTNLEDMIKELTLNDDMDDDDDDDEGVDLFGSDSEDDAAAAALKEERIRKYQQKKEVKPAIIAKSNIILDVKPWDDTTDMKALENAVRAIKKDGLLWGASKLVPVAYGVKKLQIGCVVEDDKVGTDFLEDAIIEIEDFVQSMDVAAFNKV